MGLFDQITAIPGDITGAIGQGLGGVSNAFNSLTGGNTPQYTQPTMSAGSQAAVTQDENGLLKTPQQQTDALMQGTGAASQIQNQGQNQQHEQNEEGGGGINGMSTAISNKAQKNFATKQAQLQQNANLSGAQTSMQNVNMAATQGIALANAQRGVDSSINNYNLQANQARYSTISSLMSGAGALTGAYMGSNAKPGTNYPGLSSSLNSSESTGFVNPTGESSSGYLGSDVAQPGYAADVGGDYTF
jgi:hypothetical protein